MSAIRSDNVLADIIQPSWHSWRQRAACQDLDTELFFPNGDTGESVDQIDRAKAVCAVCPVRDDCLSFAIESNQAAGVWGGLTEDERRRLRRRLARERRKAS